jgi:hypothetical protein|tara:strand:- start:252 stop:593 length:342 start_codon:yes stop_codon:yes gene_type:complete
MSLINVDLSETIASWRSKTNLIASNIGDLALLTDSAISIVAGINILTSADSTLQSNLDSDIILLRTEVYGDSGGVLNLSALNTTDKTSIVAAINDVDRRIIDVYNSAGVLLNT